MRSRLPDTFFLVYLYWVTFEWVILSPLGNIAMIQAIRNAIDILPLAFFVASVAILNITFRMHDLKILGGFLLIIVVSCLSLYIESGRMASVTSYIGVTVRFVPLLVLIRFTSDRFTERLFRNIRIIYWILAGISIISLINKQWLVSAILPDQVVFGDILPTTYNDKGISGPFINTIEFSFFLLGLTILYLRFAPEKRERTLVSVVSLVLILFSYSIASMVGLLLVFFIRSRRKWAVGLTMAAALIVLFLTNQALIEEVLGMDIKYWIEISSEFNRLGYFTRLLPEFLGGNGKDLILGMGYDGAIVDQKLANYAHAPWVMIVNENNLKYLKDVYWLSILMAQGILGFGLTAWILRTIYRSARNPFSPEDFQLLRTLLFLTIFLGFFNQILDIKAYTWCFWLAAGLVLNKPAPSYELAYDTGTGT